MKEFKPLKASKPILGVGLLAFFVSVTVLWGWVVDIERILTVVPGSSPMKVNTALAFFFSSLGLVCSQLFPQVKKWLIGVLIIPSVFIGVYTLIQYLIKPSFIIDNLFVFDHYQTLYPGRMSPATAICHIIIAISVIGSLSSSKLVRIITQQLLLCSSVISLIAISAYLLLIPSENKFFFINSMAIHTSTLFFLLSYVISLKNHTLGFTGLLLGSHAGSKLIRLVLPLIIILPITLSFILLILTGNDYLENDFGLALYTVVFISLSAIYISFIGFSLNKTDIKRKELEASLRTMLKEREQFVYITSHDLQEPLRTVSSLTENISEHYSTHLDDDGKKSMEYILQATSRMRALIKGLLDYSRIGQDKEASIVDPNSLINLVKQDLKATIEESGAILEIKPLPQVKGYENELRLLFQNLISNAIKFRKPETPPHVRIMAYKKGSYWHFSIQDNGIGIDQKHQDRIFVIFQRLHSKKVYKGTGIGLAHCRKIAELHGGQIWVNSTPGVGSTFYFSIQITTQNE